MPDESGSLIGMKKNYEFRHIGTAETDAVRESVCVCVCESDEKGDNEAIIVDKDNDLFIVKPRGKSSVRSTRLEAMVSASSAEKE
ncbi:hypothetical protein BDZ91DRAFT_803293 [Kalaharituber pfeilii]|nr:hypothetical protein BDZ91DRAFT_803293 [Kalaharituber pfeilii]